MIWHYNILINQYIMIKTRYILNVSFYNSSNSIQCIWFSKDTLLTISTNRNKIIVILRIIKIWNSGWFSGIKWHIQYTTLFNIVKGGLETLPYNYVLFQLLPFADRQFVAAVVFWVGGVALYPVVVYLVLHGQSKQNFPEVRI